MIGDERAHFDRGIPARVMRADDADIDALCAQGAAVCVVSHDVEFCAQYADRCGLLFRGEVVTENAARTFFSGNYFYTTAAARIARTAAPGAVLCGEVVQCLTD